MSHIVFMYNTYILRSVPYVGGPFSFFCAKTDDQHTQQKYVQQMWKTFRPGTPSVEKYYYVKEKENGLHNTDGCCQKRNYYKGASGSSRKRADGYSTVNAAGGRGKSSNSCKQKPQMPGSKRYRLHVKDQDQCKPGNFQRLQRPGYGASESK